MVNHQVITKIIVNIVALSKSLLVYHAATRSILVLSIAWTAELSNNHSIYLMQVIPAPLFPLAYHTAHEQLILQNIIEDRGSRYTVSVYPLSHMGECEIIRKGLDTSATHHSYARRKLQDDGSIIQDHDDDGET